MRLRTFRTIVAAATNRLAALVPAPLYLRQGRVPAFVRPTDPPALADELSALRRRAARLSFGPRGLA